MPEKRIKGPDGKVYKFPDAATDDQIVAFFQEQPKAAPAAEPAKPKETLSPMRQAIALGSSFLGPLGELSGALARTKTEDLVDALPTAGGITGGVLGLAGGVPGAIAGATLGGATGESWRQLANRWMGRTDGLPETRATTPLGASATAARDLLWEGGKQGLGEATGQAAGAVVPRVVRGVTGVFRNPNPVERAAVEFGQQQGIPVSAGVASGNPTIKGAQFLADRSLGGAAVSHGVAQRESEALAHTGAHLAGRASGGPAMSPYQGARSVTSALEQTSEAYGRQANARYDTLRQIEARPTSQVPVQVGTREVTLPVTGTRVTEPVMETMALPVDLRAAKTALRPIYERWARTWPETQQMANPAFRAIRNLVDGADYLPASIADMDLSALKGMARGAEESGREVAHGMASSAIHQLQAAVNQAVSRAGPEATAALAAGRAATRTRYGIQDVLERVKDEPVQFFKQMTATKDGAIDMLREIDRIVPGEMPNIGRAYLEEAMREATEDGAFTHAAKLASNWQKLGPQTKAILFRHDPGLVGDLDRFFLLAKKMGESPNPSQSGHIGSLITQAIALGYSPAMGIPLQGVGAAMSRLMHSRAGVRLLTEGVTIPAENVARRTAYLAKLGAYLSDQQEKDDQ